MGLVGVGDEIVAINKKQTKDIETLNKILKKPSQVRCFTLLITMQKIISYFEVLEYNAVDFSAILPDCWVAFENR